MVLFRTCLCVVLVNLCMVGGSSGAGPAKPKVPSGRDPGGIAVVMIGEGLDYTRQDIARRLARDGEGEMIAWDSVDRDPRPYAAGGSAATALARIVLGEGPATKLIAIRMAAGEATGMIPALQFASRTSARIVSVIPPALAHAVPQSGLAGAASRLPQALIVMGARHFSTDAAERPNVLIVTALGVDGSPGPTAAVARADLGVTMSGGDEPAIAAAQRAGAVAEDVAVARIAAMGARLAASEPGLDGAALKARLLSHGKPLPAGRADGPDRGWIADVGRVYRRE